MQKHEIKSCPRCMHDFECKVGSILLCQCTLVSLDEEERKYIREQFDDCLCASCMKDLKQQYHELLFTQKLKLISQLFKGRNHLK